MDKFKEMHLTAGPAEKVAAPLIFESPVNIECRIKQVIPLGSHDMFLSEVLGVDIDEKFLNKDGKFELNDAGLIVYSHGTYFSLGKELGTFGYSVKKR